MKMNLKLRRLQYSAGHILHGGAASPTLSLKEYVSKNGLKGVEDEINRALDNVEKDPPAAIGAAGNILEAVFKYYLERNQVLYSEKDTLSPLWEKVATHMDIRKKLENEEVAKVVSGLNKIVDGILHLRNKKSSAHGKSESQIKAYTILPRHARLAKNRSSRQGRGYFHGTQYGHLQQSPAFPCAHYPLL